MSQHLIWTKCTGFMLTGHNWTGPQEGSASIHIVIFPALGVLLQFWWTLFSHYIFINGSLASGLNAMWVSLDSTFQTHGCFFACVKCSFVLTAYSHESEYLHPPLVLPTVLLQLWHRAKHRSVTLHLSAVTRGRLGSNQINVQKILQRLCNFICLRAALIKSILFKECTETSVVMFCALLINVQTGRRIAVLKMNQNYLDFRASIVFDVTHVSAAAEKHTSTSVWCSFSRRSIFPSQSSSWAACSEKEQRSETREFIPSTPPPSTVTAPLSQLFKSETIRAASAAKNIYPIRRIYTGGQLFQNNEDFFYLELYGVRRSWRKVCRSQNILNIL